MEERQSSLRKILSILNNRLLIFFVLCIIAFSYITNILFEIQIVEGAEHYGRTMTRTPRTIHIPPERGNIFDRFGRPLAVNIPTRSVMFDPSINIPNSDINKIMLNLLNLLERNNEIFFDVLPVTQEEPFEFTFSGDYAASQRLRFFGNSGLGLTIDEHPNDVDELFDILIQRFSMSDIIEEKNLSPIEIRNLISLRVNLHFHRYRRFEPITIAMDVGMDTVTSIAEDSRAYASAFITTEFLRDYPAGQYLSHIVGYIGVIREEQDARFWSLEDVHGTRIYSPTDLLGHAGIERAFEEELRGHRGQEQIYTNAFGHRLAVVPNSRVEPVHGSDIFLTIDKYLQIESFHILRDAIADIIINRMTRQHHTEPMLTPQIVLSSLVAANNIEPRLVFDSEPESVSYRIRSFVLSVDPEADVSTRDDRNRVNRIISQGILDGNISPTEALVMLHEQGIVAAEEPGFRQRALFGAGTANNRARDIIIESLRNGDISPSMTNVDPSTGSLVLVDVHTGEVLAAVSYPSFDNNQLVNNINNAYFARLLNNPSAPLVNRAFNERLAPGSVFKMITGIAGLEHGIITPNTIIRDQVQFTRAGNPYPESWSWRSLGNLNYAQALAISSNYFFYETAFNLSRAGTGNYVAQTGIERLNMFMRAFGLDNPTGVEIGELIWNSERQMASPELQDHQYRIAGRPTRQWTHGDTVRVGIGQQTNAYTAATMARFTAGLASRGNMVDLRLLDRIISEEGTYIARTRPFDMGVEISDSTWDATHQGMLWVTQPHPIRPWGTESTLHPSVFANFPFGVAAKTGTAQQDIRRLSHTTFNAFAPAEDPQVAIYVIIPFGASLTINPDPSPSSRVARDVLAAYFGLNIEQEVQNNGSTAILIN